MRQKTGRKLLGVLLTLAMVIGLMPGMSMTAYAAEPINLSTLTDNYMANDGDVLTGTLGGNYKISIADGATVTLNDVTINGTNDTNCRWAGITCEGDATIILSGTNIVKGFYRFYPGISVPVAKTLTIKGSGSLTASPCDDCGAETNGGAGIGAFYRDISIGKSFDCGNIVIEGGTINATGGQYGAGIGGTFYNGCGNITITGGTVTATGGRYAPGIGGGYKTGGGNIRITGGTITATGGEKCPGIGAQRGSFTPNLGDITITDGVTSVTATGGNSAPYSIGASDQCSCGTITIGGTVTGNISTNPYTYPLPHTHSFTYSASGTTLTATCKADGCDLPPSTQGGTDHAVSLTLSATAASYTGSAYIGASLSDTTAWTGAGLTAPTIEYVGRGSTSYTKSTTAPTNAGTYTASITVDTDKTATADFTISPMALTIDAATATNRAYDKDNTAVTISAVTFKDSSSNPVALTLDTDYTVTGAMADANAGDGKTVTVTVTLKNGNYSLATNTATTTVDISKAAAQTIADVTDTLVYSATSVSESVADKMPDDAGTLSYTAGDATKTGSVTVSGFAVNNSGNVTATLSGGAAGDTVTLPVAIGSTNYADSYVNVKITLTEKGTQTITAADVTATYGDTDKSVSASVTDPATGGGAVSYAVKDGSGDYISVNESTGALTIKAVPPTDGKAYVIVTAAETDDYAEATKEVVVTISPAEVTVTAKDQSIYVNGTVPDLSAPVLDTHYTVTGLKGEDALTTAPVLAYQKDGSAATPDNTTAGIYDIVASGAAASDNYTITYANGTLTISDKGTQTITADDVTVTYGDTDKKVSASVTDPTEGGGAISYAVKEGSGDYIEVNAETGALTIKKVPENGTAIVTATAAETPAYAAASTDVTVTIEKADAAAATVTANSRNYDGTDQPLVTVTGEAVGGEMQYALGTVTEATGTYAKDIPTATDAGTYYVWYKVVGDENHKDTAPAYVTTVIKGQISATVTFKVVNGSWNDGEETTADRKVTLTGKEGDVLKLTAEQIPAVGAKPSAGYKTGAWNVTPSTETEIKENTTFIYTYAEKAGISATVTFKVVNGSWNDGEGGAATSDRTVVLTGKEGDVLKLTAEQIPAVGAKPGEGYQAGAWDVTPSTETEIKENTTFIYTYAAQKGKSISYTTYEGEGGEYKHGSDGTLTFVFKRSENDSETFAHFTGLKYDGRSLTRDKDYTAKAGSVIITLDHELLESMMVGNHILTAVFDDGEADAHFTVIANAEPTATPTVTPEPTVTPTAAPTATPTPTPTPKPVPKTGDNSNPVLWLAMMILGLAVLAGTAVKVYRKRQ